jgi:uncharacterized protein YbjT (DUF2867 family)
MILVTAAHGNQGKLLIPKLLAADQHVRACVQSQASAEYLRALGVQDVLVGDISEPAVLAKAVRGVEKIYHVGPTAHPRERDIGFAIIDASRAEGVEHFVFSSVLHAIITDLVQHEIKRDIEEHLLSSGLEFTILQPSNYMLPVRLRPAFDKGVFELPWSLERRQSLVDLGDVTDVARTVLTESERHAGATYELAGPGRHTAHDLGGIIAGVLDRPIEVRQLDTDTYLKSWFGEADPEQVKHQVRVIRAIISHYSNHDFVGNPNVLSWLLQRPPTTFAEFVRQQYQTFVSTAPA